MPVNPKLPLVLVALIPLLTGCSGQDEPEPDSLRIATFNIAMGLEQAGDMAAALESGNSARLEALATILRVVRPDVVLLNEFDYDPGVDAANLLNRHYLSRKKDNLEPLEYPYSYRPPVNTGVDSGLDLDGNGSVSDPADAWGFGRFPGQYGMLLLSRFPIDDTGIRTFQHFLWSAFPEAKKPVTKDGSSFYPDEVWKELRLSSKNHVDVPVLVAGHTLHVLASHPTPPVYDGPEDRNGRRNFDEIGFWTHYFTQPSAQWIRDDAGKTGGLSDGASFVLLGDLNADPIDGDAFTGSIRQLLSHASVNSSCTPSSTGGAEASDKQGGVNVEHGGDPSFDTSDFGDESAGNLRLDYVLPSSDLEIMDCGVFWPGEAEPFNGVVEFSDHRLVWLDLAIQPRP